MEEDGVILSGGTTEAESRPTFLSSAMYSEEQTENHTYIDVSQTDEDEDVDEEKIELLNKYNRGTIIGRNRTDKEKARRRDNHALLQSIASSLRLTKRQKKRASVLFDEVESKQRGVKKIAFGICVVVVNEKSPYTRYWPGKDENDKHFEKFVENNDFDPLPAINQVKENLDV